MDNTRFQYCQKIIVFSQDENKILLCKRKGEADYDGVFSFIGGKMETTDKTIIGGLKREKDEEIGENCKIKIYPNFTHNVLFQKKDGSSMVLPHFYAIHESGEIELNEEYSEYKWIEIDRLEEFEPKIPNIPEKVREILRLKYVSKKHEFKII